MINVIRYLTICQLLILSGCYSNRESQELKEYTSQLGFKGDKKVLDAILFAAKAYGLNPEKLVRIATIESGLNPNAKAVNKNNTTDIGLFQINSSNWNTECKHIDVHSIEGNAICAAKLIANAKQYAKVDPFWIGRYNSKTPSLKKKYFNKYKNAKVN